MNNVSAFGSYGQKELRNRFPCSHGCTFIQEYRYLKPCSLISKKHSLDKKSCTLQILSLKWHVGYQILKVISIFKSFTFLIVVVFNHLFLFIEWTFRIRRWEWRWPRFRCIGTRTFIQRLPTERVSVQDIYCVEWLFKHSSYSL